MFRIIFNNGNISKCCVRERECTTPGEVVRILADHVLNTLEKSDCHPEQVIDIEVFRNAIDWGSRTMLLDIINHKDVGLNWVEVIKIQTRGDGIPTHEDIIDRLNRIIAENKA